jgi:hypothetical protein
LITTTLYYDVSVIMVITLYFGFSFLILYRISIIYAGKVGFTRRTWRKFGVLSACRRTSVCSPHWDQHGAGVNRVTAETEPSCERYPV